MNADIETLIIGAGPAGLTAGYLLTKEGRDVLIIERDETYVGGISRTVDYKGFLFDVGGHRFFSKSKEVVDLWREILPDDFIQRPRLSRIFYGGKFYSYPLKAREALFNLGIMNSVACVLSYAWARVRPVKDPKTFHQWVRNQFGERLFSIFFRTYTEKVWGMSCDDISADWAAQRIKGLDLFSAIKNALGFGGGGKGQIKTLIQSFDYPRRGPGMMWETAADKIRAKGGTILMGRTLSGMSWNSEQGIWTVSVSLASGEIETFTARNVISSAPIRELSTAMSPRPLSLFHARELKYRDFLTVALIIRSETDLFPDNWIYIHDPSVKVGRVQNFLSWSPDMVPAPGYACLGLEYFCFEGDGLWSADDQDLVALAKKEIGQIGLCDPDLIVDACVVRQPKAYPVYDEEYRDHVMAIRLDMEGSFPTLHLVGRNGMHKYNNQDHAMMTAMLTVKNILAGKRVYDVWGVNEDAEYSESGTSGERAALASERLVPGRAA
ncbi:protoporphyrinogen oxidase [Terrihabitans soli]|uniref:Protoporphyrinogen oxidase n=1 Tax=Terrihabitans soli TaxID=708113 RepID=A0A6S6QYL9_9HYPH|nr:NAD(P)/FAD-dependent oxidoreductase [Terrihabitans soli]BCJ92372.1 protoporphyrinogen oxidase [Terrihabitans soli]